MPGEPALEQAVERQCAPERDGSGWKGLGEEGTAGSPLRKATQLTSSQPSSQGLTAVNTGHGNPLGPETSSGGIHAAYHKLSDSVLKNWLEMGSSPLHFSGSKYTPSSRVHEPGL